MTDSTEVNEDGLIECRASVRDKRIHIIPEASMTALSLNQGDIEAAGRRRFGCGLLFLLLAVGAK